MDVDDLAQEIRRVDGNNSLGAGALAEALMPFIERAYREPTQACDHAHYTFKEHGRRCTCGE